MKRLPSRLAACAVLAMAGLVPQAQAQPTGNPRGTVSPRSDNADKAPAGGASQATGRQNPDSGKLVMPEAPAEVRRETMRSPGTGTAGGLPKQKSQDGTANDLPRDGNPRSKRPVSP